VNGICGSAFSSQLIWTLQPSPICNRCKECHKMMWSTPWLIPWPTPPPLVLLAPGRAPLSFFNLSRVFLLSYPIWEDTRDGLLHRNDFSYFIWLDDNEKLKLYFRKQIYFTGIFYLPGLEEKERFALDRAVKITCPFFVKTYCVSTAAVFLVSYKPVRAGHVMCMSGQ